MIECKEENRKALRFSKPTQNSRNNFDRPVGSNFASDVMGITMGLHKHSQKLSMGKMSDVSLADISFPVTE